MSFHLLPGMNVAAGPKLAAAVTNAGGRKRFAVQWSQIHLFFN